MPKRKAILWKIIGLELLIIVFYTINGAYSSITEPTNPVLQFIGLVPLALGILIYLIVKKRWNLYFFDRGLANTKHSLLLILPLVLIIAVIIIGNKGFNTSSLSDLILMFIMQIFVVGFIEESFFRGFMLRLLLSKGVTTAVWVTSILFGITHALQLLGGQSLEDTIIQIVYALLVGLMLSLLILNKITIWITILFHGLNNFSNFMGNVEGPMLTAYLIIAIMLVYTIYLWMRLKHANNIRQDLTISS